MKSSLGPGHRLSLVLTFTGTSSLHLRNAAELDGMAGRWREEVPVNVNTKERR
jgi:hypothetical protein